MGRGLRGQVINLFLNVRVCGDTELLVKFIISILILAPTRRARSVNRDQLSHSKQPSSSSLLSLPPLNPPLFPRHTHGLSLELCVSE